MNLGLIAAIGVGLYFISKSNKPKFAAQPSRLPKSLFQDFYYDGITGPGLIPLDINSKGDLYKTKLYDTNLNYVMGPKGTPVSPEVVFIPEFTWFLGIKPEKRAEGLKYLYDKNYKLMNNTYRDFIIAKIKNANNDPELINNLPIIIGKYFDLLKKADIPESKWPSDDLGI